MAIFHFSVAVEYLARVENRIRIKRLFDLAHQIDGAAKLSCSRNDIFPCPTPCSPVQVPSMASARAFSRATKVLDDDNTFRRLVVEQHQDMEIAVAGVTDDRRQQSVFLDIGPSRGNAFGKFRDRYAHVRRQRGQFRRQSLARPNRRRGAPSRACCALRDCWSRGTPRRRIRPRSRRIEPIAARPSRPYRETPRTMSAARHRSGRNSDCRPASGRRRRSSMRATGMPIWMVMMTASQAAFTLGKAHAPPAIFCGMPSAGVALPTSGRRAFLGTDKEPGQIVAGG